MTTSAPAASYRPPAGAYDEMLDATGRPRGHWAHLSGALTELGLEELLRRRQEAARLVDQDGVVYNTYEDSSLSRPGRRWLLDPVPTVISSRDWEAVESGLIERAELLNLVLEDLYGERELLRRGLLPPEIVLGHPGFLRPCDQIRLPGSQQLFSYAADLGRDAEGNPLVLSDRTQTPSGFGYALENRTVVSRVFPTLYRDAQVHRLAPFFRSLRVALQACRSRGDRRSADRGAHARTVERDRVRARLPRLHARVSARRGNRPDRARRVGVDALARSARAGPRDPPAGRRDRSATRSSCGRTRSSASPAWSRPRRRGSVSVVNSLGSERAREPRPDGLPAPAVRAPPRAARCVCRACRPGGAATSTAAATCSPISPSSCSSRSARAPSPNSVFGCELSRAELERAQARDRGAARVVGRPGAGRARRPPRR